MSKAAEHKGLRIVEKGKARRGKRKKIRTKNTRFGIAAVHRQAGTKVSGAEAPAQTSATAVQQPADEISALEATPEPVADEKTGIRPAPAALVARRGNHFTRHPLMTGVVIAVLGLFSYRYWFSGQGAEEQILVTRTAAPVSTAAETATSPTASPPAVTVVPDRTVSAKPTSPAAPVHMPEFRPTPPPAETVEAAEPTPYREDVIASVPEEESPAIAATTAPPVPELPATQPAARTPGYGYYPQQQPWQQPWQQPYYPTANPRYRYR